jgi:hypothetical protein
MADGNPGGAGGGGGPRKRSFADTLKTFTKTKKKQKKRQQQADPTGFLLLACRFKNERHIWYEYIHHYFAEGVDHILLIDDNSDDEFVEYNSWLDSLIDERKVTIKRPLTGSQTGDYQAVMPFMKKFEWLLVVDADEFVFCPQPDKSLKQILQTKLRRLTRFGFVGAFSRTTLAYSRRVLSLTTCGHTQRTGIRPRQTVKVTNV